MKKSLIIAATVGVIVEVSGYCFQKKKYSKLLEVYRGVADKNLDIFLLFDQWLEKKQKGICLSSYFEKYGYKNIAIYGMGKVGQRLVDELQKSDVKVDYVIDKNADYVHTDMKVYRPEDDLPGVDAVIVTPISYFFPIKNQLKDKVDCPIISAEDIAYEI